MDNFEIAICAMWLFGAAGVIALNGKKGLIGIGVILALLMASGVFPPHHHAAQKASPESEQKSDLPLCWDGLVGECVSARGEVRARTQRYVDPASIEHDDDETPVNEREGTPVSKELASDHGGDIKPNANEELKKRRDFERRRTECPLGAYKYGDYSECQPERYEAEPASPCVEGGPVRCWHPRVEMAKKRTRR